MLVRLEEGIVMKGSDKFARLNRCGSLVARSQTY